MPSHDERFFCNRDCIFFPCHKTSDEENFNCIYCFCPLYTLGDKCGGNYTYTADGVKSCENCCVPHSKGGTEHINKKLPEVIKMASKKP